jgi:hypothetical protein
MATTFIFHRAKIILLLLSYLIITKFKIITALKIGMMTPETNKLKKYPARCKSVDKNMSINMIFQAEKSKIYAH